MAAPDLAGGQPVSSGGGGGSSPTSVNPETFVARLKTEAELAAAYDNAAGTLTMSANGAGVIDGKTVALNDVVLVDQQDSNRFQNGIYTVTQVGDGSTPMILTRHEGWSSTSNMITNTLVTVAEGNRFSAKEYRLFYFGTLNIGTTLIYAGVNYLDLRTVGRSPQAPGRFVADYLRVVDFPATYTASNGYLTATSNGTFKADGADVPVGAYVLLTGCANKAHNGYHQVLVAGDGSTAAVLGRPFWYREDVEIAPGAEFSIRYGVRFGRSVWRHKGDTALATVGTDDIEFEMLSNVREPLGPPMFCLPLGEGSGLVANDAGPLGFNGTISAGCSWASGQEPGSHALLCPSGEGITLATNIEIPRFDDKRRLYWEIKFKAASGLNGVYLGQRVTGAYDATGEKVWYLEADGDQFLTSYNDTDAQLEGNNNLRIDDWVVAQLHAGPNGYDMYADLGDGKGMVADNSDYSSDIDDDTTTYAISFGNIVGTADPITIEYVKFFLK